MWRARLFRVTYNEADRILERDVTAVSVIFITSYLICHAGINLRVNSTELSFVIIT
jgi:hypothetical protein